MKKRHRQKLVVVALATAVMLNIPLLLMFNKEGDIFGIPFLFAGIFLIWIASIIFSFIIIKRHYE